MTFTQADQATVDAIHERLDALEDAVETLAEANTPHGWVENDPNGGK